MGADWGLYSALRSTDNWAQKRQDKMQSLMLLEKREQRAQQDLQTQMQLEQGMQEYFDEIAKLDALAEDQGRIQEEEKKARREIYKGIAAVNGNLKNYMSTGGISQLSKYRRDVLGSDAVKNAALNKVNMTNFIKDKSEGKYIRNVEVEIPVMEKDGKTPKMKDGKIVTEKKVMTMEEQAKLFKDGIINKLNYNGAEQKVKLDPIKFSKTVKDPNNPFVAMPVTTGDIYNYAIEQGASDEYAKQVAKEYGKMAIKSKQPWYWAKEDEYAAMEKMAKAQKYASGSGSGGGVMTLNQTMPKLMRARDFAKSTGKAVPVVIGPNEQKAWTPVFGVNFVESENRYAVSRPLKVYDAHTKDEVDVTNALNFVPQEYVVNPYGDGKIYMSATVTYDADNPIAGNPHKENFFGMNSLVNDEARNNWQFINADQSGMNIGNMEGFQSSTDMVKGQVLIPIDKYVEDQAFMDQINKFVGVKSNFEGAAGSFGAASQSYQFGNEYETLVQGTMDMYNIDRDKAEQMVNKTYRSSY